MQSDRDLTEIEAAWGTTMRGPAEQGIERAHRDSHASVAPGKAMEREAREAIEEATLRPGATRSQGAGDRLTEEAPDQTRTCFERDRDRILHAASFRRLAGKTQVFVFPDDHQRTRLTHALEVTQVARSVSWALGLNVPLTEAIALHAAIDYVAALGPDRLFAHEAGLARQLRDELRALNSVTLFGPEESAGIVSFAIEGVHPHDLGTILDEENVAIRAGHHCCQPLMDHLGVPATARASFGVYSDQSDIEALMRGIERTLKIFA